MSSHYNANTSYLFVNEKEIFKIKGDNKNVNFPTQFSLETISNGFSATESREVSLNGKVYDVSVNYNAIDKSGILNILMYVIIKNNIKQCSNLTCYLTKLNFTKHAFIALLSFSKTLATKCISLSKETCKIRPTLINLNPAELKYYPLMISLEKCSGSCNSVNDLYGGIYVFYIK